MSKEQDAPSFYGFERLLIDLGVQSKDARDSILNYSVAIKDRLVGQEVRSVLEELEKKSVSISPHTGGRVVGIGSIHSIKERYINDERDIKLWLNQKN